jgi:hypothetical protein
MGEDRALCGGKKISARETGEKCARYAAEAETFTQQGLDTLHTPMHTPSFDGKVCTLPNVGKRYFVKSVNAIGICAEVDFGFEKPVRINFDLNSKEVQTGALKVSDRFHIEDLQEITQ